MPVSKTETNIDITPIQEDETLNESEKEVLAKAEKRMESYAKRGIAFIQCPQCGTLHKAHNLAGLISCNSLYQTTKGEYKKCVWRRPQTPEENHRQEEMLQRQIKRAIEGRSKKSDLFFTK